MFEYDIFANGSKCGTACAEADGLYWNIEAQSRAGLREPRRLYAKNGSGRLLLGVLIPEGDTAKLKKRVSARTFSFTDDTEITFDESEWSPFSGEVAGYRVQNARRNKDRIAFPFETEMPLPVLSLFCFLKPEVVEGRMSLVLDLRDLEQKTAPAPQSEQLTASQPPEQPQMPDVPVQVHSPQPQESDIPVQVHSPQPQEAAAAEAVAYG